jgi:hypothetical protein
LLTLLAAAASLCAAVPIVSASGASSVVGPPGAANALSSGKQSSHRLGITNKKIKHVWLIILENKSYDATFTGLNKNTYLWQTLPAQGTLLKNYYGTGHFSLDNYVSMVSGQAPQSDTQADCPNYDKFSGSTDTSVKLKTPTTVRSIRPRAPTPPPAQMAASIRQTCRRCSTSSIPPV